jgi:dihydropteroate synthase
MPRTPKRILICRRHKLDLSKKTHVMGILNVTPDSFSDGATFLDVDSAYKRALQMQKQGADIIDIGGESTRPGAKEVSADVELSRVIPVIKKLRKKIKIPISVDTTKYKVAEAALEEGASLVNDISGLRFDPEIAGLCARYKAALILMHMQGNPRTMQKQPSYKHLFSEISSFLKISIKTALQKGVSKRSIVIDPGIGFGKSLDHNLKIIKGLSCFKSLGLPILLGLSRKSFIGKILGVDVDKRLIPTVAANSIAVYNGADILRVHDVEEAVASAHIIDAIKKKDIRL